MCFGLMFGGLVPWNFGLGCTIVISMFGLVLSVVRAVWIDLGLKAQKINNFGSRGCITGVKGASRS